MKSSYKQPLIRPYCYASHLCHCEFAAKTPHVVGDQGCEREMVASPEPFAKDPDTGAEMWVVDGQIITEYTMKHQRIYIQHECGCWSRNSYDIK